MIPRLVPKIEGGYPERDGGEEEGEEGLVLTYSSSWMAKIYLVHSISKKFNSPDSAMYQFHSFSVPQEVFFKAPFYIGKVDCHWINSYNLYNTDQIQFVTI